MKSTDQQNDAGARPATERVCLPPGRIMQHMAGTIAWGATRKPRGMVGSDVPAQMMVELINGKIRPLTPAEARLLSRWKWNRP